jgi:hypothetical protein
MLALIWVRQSVRCKYVQKHSFVEDHVSPVYILLLFCLGAAPLKQTACNRWSLQLVHPSVFQGFNLWNKKVPIFTCAGTNETCSTRNRAYLNKLNTPLSNFVPAPRLLVNLWSLFYVGIAQHKLLSSGMKHSLNSCFTCYAGNIYTCGIRGSKEIEGPNRWPEGVNGSLKSDSKKSERKSSYTLDASQMVSISTA